MPTVAEVCEFLAEFAPPELAESWDNTGLLIGREKSDVVRILTCLTLSPEVAEEAVHGNAQLIVTHHPVLFRGAKQISDRTPEGKMLLTLIEAGISVYSPHTAFDSAAGGINQQLATAFGIQDPMPLQPAPTNPAVGSGRYGTLRESSTLAAFMSGVQQAVGADRLEYCGEPESSVYLIGIGCGAAEGFLKDAVGKGCDTFITGEARFHTAVEARTLGINLILLGHFFSERPAIEQLAMRLQHRFPEMTVWPSRAEKNPLTFFNEHDR
jgi:dinuclear metal center YbgI/SA1388 family protein